MSLKATTLEKLALLEARPNHSLGQNFLIDEHVLNKIISLSQVTAKDVVLEIGPGLGTLTQKLCALAKRVVAIEADASLAQFVKTLSVKCQLDVVQQDALSLNYSQLARDEAPTKLVSNLPYQIAARVVYEVFKSCETVQSACVMVQKEVAERMRAATGTKDYSAYTAKLALYATPVASFVVSPASFYPKPHVTSEVVRLERADTKLSPKMRERTARLITVAFKMRRKTLANNVKQAGYDMHQVERALGSLGFDARVRAEALSTQDFVELEQELMA